PIGRRRAARAQRGSPKARAACRMILAVATTTDSWLERAPVLLRDWLVGFLPEALRWPVGALLAIVVLLFVFATLFALLTLAERKILGRVQNRPGPNRTGIPL